MRWSRILALLTFGLIFFQFLTIASADQNIIFGSEYVFRSDETTCTSVDFLTSNKFVVAYGNCTFQAVRIGEVSGNSISWGPEYTFSPCTWGISVTALNSTHIVVARKGESEKGIAVVGEVSGNTISFGSEVVFYDGKLYNSPKIDALDNSHVVIAFNAREVGYKGRCLIGTVSGTSISFGSVYTFNNDETYYISVSKLTSSKFVITYSDSGNEYGRAIIGTVSDSSISFGSEYTFDSNTLIMYTSVSALTSDKFVIAYRDHNGHGASIIGTVSGSSISFGSKYIFNSALTNWISASALTSDKFVVAYEDNDGWGKTNIGTVSDSDISFGSKHTFNFGTTYHVSTTSLSSDKFVVAYEDYSNSKYGTAIVGDITTNQPTTISDPQPSDGSTNIQVTLSQLSVEITDPDGDLMNWSIETSPDIGSNSGNNANNGTITCPVSGLKFNTTYTWYVNVTDGYEWTRKVYTFTTETLQPPQNIAVVKINDTHINITWTKGSNTDVTLIRKKSGDHPSNPSDGTLVYNGTGEYCVTEWQYNDFFTLWSYNATANEYSDPVNLEFGGLRIYCYNESNVSQAIEFNITVYIGSLTGDEVYVAYNCENPVIITSADVPTGLVIISVSADGYKPRIFYKYFVPPVWDTIYAYLPPESEAQLYYIGIEDKYGVAIPDAYITIQKIIDDSYYDISIVKTRGDGSADIYLIPGDTYRLKIEKEGYETRYESLIPSTNQYIYIFKIYSAGNLPLLFGEEIGQNVFLSVIALPGIANISYTDNATKTNWVHISIYNSSSLVSEFNYSQDSFSFNVSLPRDLYRIVFEINREWHYRNLSGSDFYAVKTLTFTRIVYIPGASRNWLEDLFTSLLGESPFGWLPLIVFIFVLFIFFSFAPAYSHLAMIASGLVLLFFNFIIGINIASTTVAGFVIFMGILLAYKQTKMRGELP